MIKGRVFSAPCVTVLTDVMQDQIKGCWGLRLHAFLQGWIASWVQGDALVESLWYKVLAEAFLSIHTQILKRIHKDISYLYCSAY